MMPYLKNSIEFKSPRICYFTFHVRLIFFPFTEVLSERFSVNASGGGGRGRGGGAAFICYCLVVFVCFYFVGEFWIKKGLTIFPEGDRSYICLMGIFGY